MNIEQIVEDQQIKMNECLEIVQQQLDIGFNKIDELLDQIPLFNSSINIKSTINLEIPIIQISLDSLKTLPNQIIQEIKPIINQTINKQIKQKQQHLSQQLYQLENQQQSNQIINNNPFQYKLISNNSIKQEDQWCNAIAFNKDNSIVLAACENDITVFEFKQEQLKQTQLLKEHKNRISTLNFMKKSNQFISGSWDYQIIIWQMNQNNQWISQQILNEHKDQINCLLLNNNEDIIISGSDDKTIKFWIKQDKWICSQTITDHTNDVNGLSMNEQQNKVISCGYDCQILIIEQSQQNKNWNVIQKIKVQDYGYRICFINENLFTFQPYCKEQMHIYEMNNINKQYSKTKEIDVKCGYNQCYYYFPQQYIKQKCLLVNKNGFNVNLIRMNQNGDLILQQSIDYGDEYIYGQMSEDGQYFISWDCKSYEIQIRKYHQEQ
ncbi:unnamed protein product [Paramecium primaurelia]|uniref:WD40-repeat-containing domain n=1 Tax=Paramecium primaurelia TaxID=5886 RepID=A0A8S1QPQ1_PARPR|nr:unnamed protein product [Paramecium primaurelia]